MSKVSELFYQFCQDEGYDAWFETEDRWMEWSSKMVEAGIPEECVRSFFSELAEEL